MNIAESKSQVIGMQGFLFCLVVVVVVVAMMVDVVGWGIPTSKNMFAQESL